SIDGMLVEPGDLIVADDDGVLCVPYDDAAEICKMTQAKKASEEKSIQQILAGTPDRRWVDETLQRLGCEYKDERKLRGDDPTGCLQPFRCCCSCTIHAGRVT